MAHDHDCGCKLCRGVRRNAVAIIPTDRQILAGEWCYWYSSIDGEGAELRAGENGNPGSPRWIALQAIARSRIAASASYQPVEPGSVAAEQILRRVVREFSTGRDLESAIRATIELAWASAIDRAEPSPDPAPTAATAGAGCLQPPETAHV